MMFCEHPERFFPVTQVDIVIFPEGSIEKPDLMIEVPKIVGPVPKIIKETLSYLRTNVIKQKLRSLKILKIQTRYLTILIKPWKKRL